MNDTPLDALAQKAGASTGDTAASKAALESTVADETPTPPAGRFSDFMSTMKQNNPAPAESAENAAAAPARKPVPADSPFADPAKDILTATPNLDDETRAILWDHFTESKDANELATRIAPLTVSNSIKHSLWTAKQQAAPPVAAIDKVSAVMNQLANMDPTVLDMAEQHPNVLKALTLAKD